MKDSAIICHKYKFKYSSLNLPRPFFVAAGGGCGATERETHLFLLPLCVVNEGVGAIIKEASLHSISCT